MSEFQRQHPAAALSSALGLIRGNLVTILIFLFVGAQSGDLPFMWWLIFGFGFLLIAGAANWWRFQYKIEDGELHIKSGIFVRKNLYLTKDRVQVIDITAGVVQRLFRLVKVDIQTAGASSRQAAIEAVSLERAKEINRMLRGGSGDPSPGEAAKDGGENGDAEAADFRIRLPGKELLIAASTSGSFGIALSILGTAFSQIEPFIRESDIYSRALDLFPAETDLVLILSLIFVFIVFAWLLSFVSTLISYGDFMLQVRDNEIVVTRGILEKKRITVPYNRIQAVHVAEGIIRQPLGYASLHLESAGYGDDKGTGSIVLFPLIKRENILPLLNDILPDYQKETGGMTPPARSLRRYLFRSAFLVSVVTAAAYWFFSLNNWIWLVPLLALYWGWLKYRDAAAGRGDDIFLLRSRFLSKTTAYIRKNRIQDVTIRESWFQRRRNLCSVRFYVASGDQGRSFSVHDLSREDGMELFQKMKGGFSGETDLHPREYEGKTVMLPGWG